MGREAGPAWSAARELHGRRWQRFPVVFLRGTPRKEERAELASAAIELAELVHNARPDLASLAPAELPDAPADSTDLAGAARVLVGAVISAGDDGDVQRFAVSPMPRIRWKIVKVAAERTLAQGVGATVEHAAGLGALLVSHLVAPDVTDASDIARAAMRVGVGTHEVDLTASDLGLVLSLTMIACCVLRAIDPASSPSAEGSTGRLDEHGGLPARGGHPREPAVGTNKRIVLDVLRAEPAGRFVTVHKLAAAIVAAGRGGDDPVRTARSVRFKLGQEDGWPIETASEAEAVDGYRLMR